MSKQIKGRFAFKFYSVFFRCNLEPKITFFQKLDTALLAYFSRTRIRTKPLRIHTISYGYVTVLDHTIPNFTELYRTLPNFTVLHWSWPNSLPYAPLDSIVLDSTLTYCIFFRVALVFIGLHKLKKARTKKTKNTTEN